MSKKKRAMSQEEFKRMQAEKQGITLQQLEEKLRSEDAEKQKPEGKHKDRSQNIETAEKPPPPNDNKAGLSAENASFLFYRHKTMGRILPEKTVKELMGIGSPDDKINGIPYQDYYAVENAKGFQLQTTYPGLLIGVGYEHPVTKSEKQSDDSQKVGGLDFGFFFDHTTGMPVIPGSTVKGILRSVFRLGKESDKRPHLLEYLNDKIGKDKTGNNVFDESNLMKCEKTLFEGKTIYYDAYISDISEKLMIFADDYIAPHTNGVFKEPIPVGFLKIAPGVKFTFQFKFHPKTLNKMNVDENNLCDLFKAIIMDFSIGAKRNTGYGRLVEFKGRKGCD